MAEYSGTSTLTTPGPDITFNAGSGDEYRLDPEMCSGLDMAPLRVPVDDAPQTDGGIVHDGFYGAWPFVLGGEFLNRTGTAAARNTMEENLRLALHAIVRADGTYSWTPSGQSARSLTVRAYVPSLSVSGGYHKRFLISLVAATPSWA